MREMKMITPLSDREVSGRLVELALQIEEMEDLCAPWSWGAFSAGVVLDALWSVSSERDSRSLNRLWVLMLLCDSYYGIAQQPIALAQGER